VKCLLIAFLSTAALAQSPLDPTQSGAYPAYPAYLNHSCGGVALTVLQDAGTVAMVSAKTTCSTGGRGSKPRNYLACWRVTFAADRYSILAREQVLYATWTQGQAGYACPGL
jgi:hypothetical protein